MSDEEIPALVSSDEDLTPCSLETDEYDNESDNEDEDSKHDDADPPAPIQRDQIIDALHNATKRLSLRVS